MGGTWLGPDGQAAPVGARRRGRGVAQLDPRPGRSGSRPVHHGGLSGRGRMGGPGRPRGTHRDHRSRRRPQRDRSASQIVHRAGFRGGCLAIPRRSRIARVAHGRLPQRGGGVADRAPAGARRCPGGGRSAVHGHLSAAPPGSGAGHSAPARPDLLPQGDAGRPGQYPAIPAPDATRPSATRGRDSSGHPGLADRHACTARPGAGRRVVRTKTAGQRASARGPARRPTATGPGTASP